MTAILTLLDCAHIDYVLQPSNPEKIKINNMIFHRRHFDEISIIVISDTEKLPEIIFETIEKEFMMRNKDKLDSFKNNQKEFDDFNPIIVRILENYVE
ncbi:MAG: hypothetical protein INQ03_10240 [Candidatus Heimdallarchaeota archaeon]|nr:hypothetical protein [Candidatus Heimdallarchaeota archaeon]